MHEALQDRFWQGRRRLYRIVSGTVSNPLGQWNHWWQSHALGVLLDRADRTGDDAARRQAADLVEGMRSKNGGVLTNDFYDDMGWLALALLRMPGHQADARTLRKAIRRGEMPEGGIAWARQHPEFRNTPATGPAAIGAVREGMRSGDDELVTWGLGLVRWMARTVVSADGDVADGQRRHGDGSMTIDAARYSYNYGLVVGADVAAFQATGERDYLDHAGLVARAACLELGDPSTGVWRSEGKGDRALFRGILARYLAELIAVSGDEALAKDLFRQGDAVWRSSRDGSAGHDWTSPPGRRLELSEQVGGLLVLEAVARLA